MGFKVGDSLRNEDPINEDSSFEEDLVPLLRQVLGIGAGYRRLPAVERDLKWRSEGNIRNEGRNCRQVTRRCTDGILI